MYERKSSHPEGRRDRECREQTDRKTDTKLYRKLIFSPGMAIHSDQYRRLVVFTWLLVTLEDSATIESSTASTGLCRVERKAKHQYNRHALSSATFPQRRLLLFMFFYSFPFLSSFVCFVVVLPAMSAIRATGCRFCCSVCTYVICILSAFKSWCWLLAERRCSNSNDSALVLCSVRLCPPHSIIILTILCKFPVTVLPFSSPPAGTRTLINNSWSVPTNL